MGLLMLPAELQTSKEADLVVELLELLELLELEKISSALGRKSPPGSEGHGSSGL